MTQMNIAETGAEAVIVTVDGVPGPTGPAAAVVSVNGRQGTVTLSDTYEPVGSGVAAPTANLIVRRDNAGRAQVNDPAAAKDIVNLETLQRFETHAQVEYAPGSALNSTTGNVMTTWFTMGSVVVPSWSTRAWLLLRGPFYQVTNAAGIFRLRVVLHPASGSDVASWGPRIMQPFDVNKYAEATMIDDLVGLVPGTTYQVQVQVYQVSGGTGGALVVDGLCDWCARFDWDA